MKKNKLVFIIVIVAAVLCAGIVLICQHSDSNVDKKAGIYTAEGYSFKWSPDEYKYKFKNNCPSIEKKEDGLTYSFVVVDCTNTVNTTDDLELLEYGLSKLKEYYVDSPIDIGHSYPYHYYPELYPDRDCIVVRGGFGSSGFDDTGFHHEMYVIQENGTTVTISIGFDGDRSTVMSIHDSIGEDDVILYFRDILDSLKINPSEM